LLSYWRSRKLPPACRFFWLQAATSTDTAAILCAVGPSSIWDIKFSECAIPWPPTPDYTSPSKGPWGTTGCFYNASHELSISLPGVRAGSISCNEIQVPCQVSPRAADVILCNENGGYNPRVICTGFHV
jgi:hypothetical protein